MSDYSFKSTLHALLISNVVKVCVFTYFLLHDRDRSIWSELAICSLYRMSSSPHEAYVTAFTIFIS